MSTVTSNLQLVKPDATDFYDISDQNGNMDKVDTAIGKLSEEKAEKSEVNELKKSVSDGKTLVASAITGKGVETSTEATFETMATNISNIETGIDTSDATATAGTILAGKTAGVKGNIITGTMADNGAITQSLGINGSYTIPAGYHNGAGKVTQSITTKGAGTYTPSDVAQTIAGGQYLSGAQTISAVPTETKTVTAGTSASTVSRTAGKYLTSVTVNPTPSQSKSVTMTSSPLTIYPDAGYLLSSVIVSADLGRKYATGTGWTTTNFNALYGSDTNIYYSSGSSGWNTLSATSVVTINTGLSWTPSVIKIKAVQGTVTYVVALNYDQVSMVIEVPVPRNAYTTYSRWTTWIHKGTYGAGETNWVFPMQGSNAYVPLLGTSILQSVTSTLSSVTWEAWE